MNDLNLKTADELIRLHNARADASARIEGSWKKSKRDLIERIRALGDAKVADCGTSGTEEITADDTAPKATERTTVRALAEAFLTAADGLELTYDEIAARIREAMPGSSPTSQSIRWYATKLRKRGEIVRVRYAPRKGA